MINKTKHLEIKIPTNGSTKYVSKYSLTEVYSFNVVFKICNMNT